MKKVLTVVLSALMIISVFVGCKPAGEPPKVEPPKFEDDKSVKELADTMGKFLTGLISDYANLERNISDTDVYEPDPDTRFEYTNSGILVGDADPVLTTTYKKNGILLDAEVGKAEFDKLTSDKKYEKIHIIATQKVDGVNYSIDMYLVEHPCWKPGDINKLEGTFSIGPDKYEISVSANCVWDDFDLMFDSGFKDIEIKVNGGIVRYDNPDVKKETVNSLMSWVITFHDFIWA